MSLTSERATVTLASFSSASFALPLFLVGALAVQIESDFPFDAAALGALIAISRGAGVVSSLPLGRVADHLGATRTLIVSASISLVAGVGVALTANSWLSLTLWMVFASLANSLGLPGTNRLLIRTVRAERRGLAFGFKQSAPPASTMVAGISVPVVALTIGWRWTFVFVAGLALILIVVLRARTVTLGSASASREERRRQQVVPLTDSWTLIVLAFGIGLGMSAATSLAAFFVSFAVAEGSPEELAGYALAAASLATIFMRIGAGARADRMEDSHLRLCAGMLVIGSLGYLVLAWSPSPTLILAGVIVSLSMGWGYNGVFWYAVTMANADRPGSVTGLMRPGTLLGGSLGPLIIGLIVTEFSYRAAWITSSAVCLLAASLMFVGDMRLQKHQSSMRTSGGDD